MGLPVAVLDGHAHESPQNPGLAQLLDDPQSHFDDHKEPSTWTVLAAAKGIQQLSLRESPRDTLDYLFSNYGVVMIYADASVVSQLLKSSGISPLLLVAPLKSSSLTAYQALKQLLLDAQLRPTVANIALAPNAKIPMATHSPLDQLQDCAMNFLGYRFDPLTIRAATTDDRTHDDINRLALQLLENAIPLQTQHFARGH
jgi:hypothetical protein